MAKWRALEEYTPFARLLVEYMWAQRPPLVPNQFAERMGVRKQALSTWLNSDTVPPPQSVLRLARGMGRPVRELMTAAGFAPDDDPLLDVADAWAYVLDEVQLALGVEGMSELETGRGAEGAGAPDLANAAVVPALPETRDELLLLLRQLQARTLAITKATVRALEDPSLTSQPEGGVGPPDVSDVIDSANGAPNEHA